MMIANIFTPPRSDMQIARLLASACVILYTIVFTIVFLIGTSNGASPERMIGLELGEHVDTVEYRMLAQTLLSEGRYALSPEAPAESARVPGYPAFLAVVLIVFQTILVVPIFQMIFTAITIALIFLIGVRYFPRPVALFAAIAYMLDPIVIFAAWWTLSESLFVLLFLASIYTITTPARRTWVPFVLSGVLLGLSAYVRPLGQYVAPIIACMALAHALSWRVGLRNVALFLLAAVVVMSPWFIRNYALSGHIAFSSIRDWQLFINMSLFEQFRTGVPYRETQILLSEPLGTTDEHLLRQFEYTDKLHDIAMPKYLAHPFQYLALYAITAEKLFISSSIVKVKYHMYQGGILAGEMPKGEGAWGMLVRHQWKDALIQTFTHIPRLVERSFLAVMYIGTILSAIMALRRRGAQATWIICTFVLIHLYALLVAPWTDDTRYRIPTEPFIFLLGGYAIYSLWPRVSRCVSRIYSRSR